MQDAGKWSDYWLYWQPLSQYNEYWQYRNTASRY